MTTPATFHTRVSFDHVRNTAAGFTAANPVLGYGVTGLETDSGKIKIGDGVTAWATLPYSGGGPVEWSNVQGKPSTFAPSAHQHPIADVTGLQSALDAKQASGSYAAASHGHAIGDVTGLQTALDAKATPADVTAAVAAVVDAAPTSLDTLNELAAALGDDANFASTVTNALAAKAPIASPTFTGTVSGVTKTMVGLGNVDNTSDAAKPVSTAQAAADSAVASAAASDATTKANAAQAAAVQRANHTGTQAISTVDGLQAALDAKAASSHTHTASAITDFTTAVQAVAPATTNASLLTSGTLADARLSGNVVLTADSRLSDARTPTDGSVTDAKIATAGLSASSINWTAVTAWAPSTSYAKGALVHYLGITYRRSVAGTSGTTFTAANWQQMTAPVNVTVTPSQVTSNQNDYALAIATADIFRISSDAARNITGITAGLFDGHAILLRNVGSFAITTA